MLILVLLLVFRLKGLTTGGLPTFSEITKSFSAGLLEEDNIIYQIGNSDRRRNGGKMTFVGGE